MSNKVDPKLASELLKWTNNAASVESQIIKKTAELQRKKAFYIEQAEKVREAIKTAMEDNDIKKYEDSVISIAYVKPGVREGFNKDDFKKDHPRIYGRYIKEVFVNSYVKITVKK